MTNNKNPASEMQYANYVEMGISNNARFNLSDPINRDDSNYPYWLLREQLLSHGVELNTPDVNKGHHVEFELHMNAIRKGSTVPAFVLLMETEQICPSNASQDLLAQYQKIFTWNDDLVDQRRYIKINFPNKRNSHFEHGWSGRDKFCCLIAGNKSSARRTTKDLYSERVRTIRWFEQNVPDRFDLYGSGWKISPPPAGWLGKLWLRAARLGVHQIGRKAFPSYRGKVVGKLETLRKYRFAVCYENVKDMPGYITEKIFDCFFSGCVPVYWGASNVTDYIPKECFIDRREFRDHESLYSFLSGMSEADYRKYQSAIAHFLESDAALPFYAETFANTVAMAILSDLKILTKGDS